jgi:hypothetical protein
MPNPLNSEPWRLACKRKLKVWYLHLMISRHQGCGGTLLGTGNPPPEVLRFAALVKGSMDLVKSNLEQSAQTITRLRNEIFKDAQRYGPLTPPKLEVLDFAFRRLGASSFADLGSAYRVDGGYSFYAIDVCGATRAVLVDTHPTDRLLAGAAERNQVEVIQGNFGDPGVIEKIGEVDAIVVFDVLLHQVAPDWDELLALYAPRTRLFIVHNPQWLGPKTVRLLDLGEEKFLASVPQIRNETVYRAAIDRPDEIAPAHGRRNRDVHHLWQWGITDEDLMSRMRSLSFALRYFQDHGYFWGLENFRSHSFIFEKAL